MASWTDLVKKYIWSEEKTPYRVPPARLTRTQAASELFVYTLFLASVAAVLAVVALGHARRHGDLLAWLAAGYAFSVVCAAVILGAGRHPGAARYCLSAPVAAGLAVLARSAGLLETGVLLGLALAWLGYAGRVVAVAESFHRPPTGPGPPAP